MKFVLIIGSGAVGKMTVGQALMKKTGLRLFYNHLMIEPVIEIFGYYDGKVTEQLREVIFKSFVESQCDGMIFTYMWAFDSPEDWTYILNIVKLFEDYGAQIYCVELVADQEIRLQRNQTENRLLHKASKRNLAFSRQCILNEDKEYRLISKEGEIPFKNYMKIDNSYLTPEIVADMIIENFGF